MAMRKGGLPEDSEMGCTSPRWGRIGLGGGLMTATKAALLAEDKYLLIIGIIGVSEWIKEIILLAAIPKMDGIGCYVYFY